MKNFAPTLRALLLTLLCALLLIAACHRAPESEPDHPQIAAGVRMQEVRFYSAALGREMPYRVFLPANLPAGQKLPVVYLLHGADNDFRTWSNNSDVSRYAARGLILVMPEGGFSYYMNAVKTPKDRYEDYITKDLIADVESRFPAMGERGSRAVVGISMGGFAAIDYAFVHPDLYSFAGTLSPSIDMTRRRFSTKRIGQWWRTRRIFGPFGSAERLARDPFELVQTADPSKTPYIYLTAGNDEPLLQAIHRFEALLKQRGFAYEFHTLPGGHDWTAWGAQIPGCFESLLKHLPAKAN
jgi:S-formylglutathione hydrolase FrmB